MHIKQLALSLALALSLPAAAPPNIIFIMADDLGYGDVHTLNPASQIPTPNLDRLAAQGMTFTDAHTPSAVCTPTRYGVITGRYCWRSRLKQGVLNGYGTPLIELDRPTVASFLRSRGYRTGIVGKWHLGLGFARNKDRFDFTQPVRHGPKELGFDFSHIIPASLDFPPYVYVRNGQLTTEPTLTQPAQKFPAFLRKGERSPDFVMENCLDDLLQQATAFVQRQTSEQPFLLYFPLTAPHKPVLPHPRFRGKTKLGPYGDFVTQVDWTVGQLINAVDARGMAENTLIIFTSDNGSFMHRRDERDHVEDETVQAYRPSNHTANGVFRGTKADIWEGGHHVPFFARWSGTVQPGSQCDEPICLTDFFATTAEILNSPLPAKAAPDSFSFLPLLKGEQPPSPRPPVVHHSAAGMFALREGRWKLVLGNGSGGREMPRGRPFQKPYQLFDLSSDIGEQTNQLDRHSTVATKLEETLEDIRQRDER